MLADFSILCYNKSSKNYLFNNDFYSEVIRSIKSEED